MVYTSKTLIPGKTPIGQNRDGSYIYDGVQTQNMSVMPSRGTYDTTKQMSVAPKPIYTPPTPLPMTKSPIGFNIMPQVNKEVAQKVNAPVKDTLNFRTKIVEDSPRVQQLRQHFRALEQKGEFQLNDKQTEYIRKFKAKYPDYANVPDVSLYSKIILAEPKAMEQYGNIGQKGIIESIVGLPIAMAKTGSDAIMEAQDKFQERQKTLNKEGNLGLTNLLASASAGRALGAGVLGMAGDVLNVASPLINPETGVTSVTEGLTRDLGTMIEKVPEEYRQQISDLITRYPKITATLGTTFDLSNLIPFLGALGKAKSVGQVDDIIRTVKARPATRFRGEVSPTAFEAGMNRSLVSDTLNIPKNVVKITPNPLNVLKRSPEKALAKNIERLQEVSINKGTRNILKRAEAKGFNPLDDVARYDDLRPEVIDGKLNTEKGIVRLSDEIDKNADILSKAIKAEGRKVSVDSAYKRMLDNIKDDLGEGLNYESAIKRAKTAFRTLKRNADEKGLVALEQLDAMKKKIYKETNYLKDTDFADKAIARALKEAVEDGTLSADVKALNNELSKGYTTINYLESIQGRAVKGGRLGNAFARVGGQVAGSALGGWAGALAGGEVAARIQNQMIKNIFKVTGKQAEKSSMFKGLNKTPIGLPPKTELKLLPPGKPVQKAMESTIITEPKAGQIKAPSSNLPSGTSEVSSTQKLLPMPKKPQKTPGKSSVLNQLSKGKEKSAGKKVNNPIIQKIAKKQETPKTPQVEGKTLEQGTFGGVKGVQPKNQAKFNQGDNFEPVRVVMNDKDSQIVRYGALRNRGLKKGFTSADNAEMRAIEKELGMNHTEIVNRSEEIKKMAREVRSAKEEVILDLTKPKQSLPLSSKSEVKTDIKGIDIQTTLKEFQGKSDKFKDMYVANIRMTNIDKKLLSDYTRVGRTEWYKKTDGNTIQAIRSDGYGVKIKSGDNAVERTIANDFIDNVIERNKYLPEKPLGNINESPVSTKPLPLSQKSEVKYSKPIEDNLVKEARKYKSAEDFVKSQGQTLYHGTNIKNAEMIKNKPRLLSVEEHKQFPTTVVGDTQIGISSSKEKLIAEYFASLQPAGKGEVVELVLPKNAKIYKLPENIDSIDTLGLKKLQQLKKEGYDAIEDFKNTGGESEIRILSPEILKTKQQLLDIWNKANKNKYLNFSQKSEVKYSKPIEKELEPLKEFLTKQKNYDDKFAELSVKANEIAKEYPGIMGTISEEGRKIPANKKILEDLAYYKKLSQDFNSLESSKKFIKQLGKMSIMERKALRNSIK